MSKKHHSKRSCLEENIKEKEEYKKKKHHKKHDKKHDKKHHKKHRDRHLEEIIDSQHIEELPVVDTAEKYENGGCCEGIHEEPIENNESYHKEDYSDKEYSEENYSEDEYSKEVNYSEENYSRDEYSKEVNYSEEDYSEYEYSKEVNYSEENYSGDQYSKEDNYHEEDYSEDEYSKEDSYSEEDYSEGEYFKEDNYSEEDYSEDEYSKEDNYSEENYSEDEYSKRDSYSEEDYPEDEYSKEDNYFEEDYSDDEYSKEDNYSEEDYYSPTNKFDECNLITECEASAETEILSFCPNTPGPVIGRNDHVVVKVPVVLAEPTIKISTESKLKLESPALEIKRIMKNVYLEQCNLVSDAHDPCFGNLFLKGFIRKNIEYATKDCYNDGTISGKIRHTTVKIPFTCAARIQFTTLPIFINTEPPEQIEIIRNNIEICSPCEESVLGNMPCQLSLRLTEFFNEKVFCELIKAEIIESDFLENPSKDGCKFNLDQTYNTIKEKVVIHLTLKLLQNQQISVNK